jgi:tetratricopeptide (TPR) repeat protein
MKQTCKYHPAEQATWYDADDGILFCDTCVASDDSADGGRARSFLTNKPLQQVGRRIAQDPFWDILSHFIEYPLVKNAALVMAAVAFAMVFLPGGLIGVGAAVAVGLVLGIYGAAVVEQSAEGMMKAPDYRSMLKPESWPVGVQLWLLFAATGAASGYAYITYGMLQGSLMTLGLWFLLPAFLIQVFLSGNILTVLFAPQRLLTALVALGLEYPAMAGVMFFLHTAAAIFVSIAYDLLPGFLSWPIAALLVGWVWLVTAHLIGYLVCRHQETLGYESQLQSESAQRRRRSRRPEEERRQAVLIREGRFDKLVSLYKSKLEKQKESLPFNEQYERLLDALGRRTEQLEFADNYLKVLIKNNHPTRAMDLVRRCREIDPAFKPATVQMTWEMAKLFAEQGQPKVAVNMLLDIHKRAPTWPGIAEAYLYLARLLATEFKLAGKAEQYIRFVESRYRDIKVRDMVQQCRQDLGLTPQA